MTRHFALVLSLALLIWGVHSEPVSYVDQQGKGLPLKGAMSKLQEKELLLKELEELAKEEVMNDGSDGTSSIDYNMPELTEKTTFVPLDPITPDEQEAYELPADEDEPLSNLQEAKILLRELEELAEEERMTDDMSVLPEKRTSALLETRWESIGGRLKFVSVGSNGVWGVNSNDDIYYRTDTFENAASSGSGWQHIGGKLKQISSGHSVWGVNANDDIYIRQGITSSNPTGTGWHRIEGKLKQLDVSSTAKQLWGVNSGDNIYRRTGITTAEPKGAGWQRISGGLKFVSVGPAGVWGVNRNDDIYYRTGTFGNEASAGSGWHQIGGKLKQISSGDNIVWGVNANDDIYVREGISSSNPTGTGWRQIPGKLKQVEANPSGSQAWGVNSADGIYQRVGTVSTGLLDPNVAAGRRAYQSSVHGEGIPGRAVDGGRSTSWGHNSCTHTVTENNPWWYVDLGKTVTVDHVAIVNRLDCCAERITPLDVHVGQSTDVARNARCGDHHRFPPGQSELTVDCNGKRGRYVGIRLPGNQRILTLCEVEVYAAPNRALGRPAVQSSVGWSGFPPRAVDGCRDPNYDQQCCTHTQAQTNPYWYVDLGSQRRVQWVVVTNRQDCCHERLSPFTIHVGNSANVASNPRCGGHHVIPAGKDKDAINCNGLRGRYVGIRLPGHGRMLTLCEVEVYEGSGYKKRTSDVRGIEGQGCGEHEEGDAWVSDEDGHNCICDLGEDVCYKVDCGDDGEQQPIRDEDGMWSCPEIPDATSEELEPEIPDETGRAMVGELPA
ncbi:uncharacterized protein LOC144872941 [Branchiostoma floridae x Branchiostoma japonicum]